MLILGEPANLQPNPTVWPVCGGCRLAYVLRRATSWQGESMWVWQRDCLKPRSKECRNAKPEVCTV